MQTVENARQYLQNCEQLHQDKKEVSFIIFHSDKPVGRIGLHHLDLNNQIGSIGYWLAEDMEGNGIITKSCCKLIDLGFQQLSLNRIEIKAAVKNIRSQAIPVRLKFQKEGILRQAEFVNDEFIDLFVYSLLREEWEGGTSSHSEMEQKPHPRPLPRSYR
jgi:ribosomal-protein-serine acetyltransferase